MATGSAALALRSAGISSRARAFPASSRWCQRPTILQKRFAVQQWSNLRNASSESTSSSTTTTETAKEAPRKATWGLRRAVLGTTMALTLFAGYVYVTDTRASIHRYLVVPLIRTFYPDAEDAHHIGVDSLKTLYKFGLHPRERGDLDRDGLLETEVNTTIQLHGIASSSALND